MIYHLLLASMVTAYTWCTYILWEQNRKSLSCRLRVLFADNNQLLCVLCLFDPSVPETFDPMWAGNMSRYMLTPHWTWWEIQWSCGVACLSLCKAWLVGIFWELKDEPDLLFRINRNKSYKEDNPWWSKKSKKQELWFIYVFKHSRYDFKMEKCLIQIKHTDSLCC